MRLRNMLKICLVFWKSEPHYAYKRYAYKRKNMYLMLMLNVENFRQYLYSMLKHLEPSCLF